MKKFKILVEKINLIKHEIANIRIVALNLEKKLDKLIEDFDIMISEAELVENGKERLSVPKNGGKEKRRSKNEKRSSKERG